MRKIFYLLKFDFILLRPLIVAGLFLLPVFNVVPEIGAQDNGQDWPVKVLILSHVQAFDLSVNEPVDIKRFYTNEPIGEISSASSIKVQPVSAGLVFDNYKYKIFGVNLTSLDDGRVNFCVNKRNYRGNISLIRESDMSLSVINQVPLEEYLAGVLPSEIPAQWPDEALKAQAIAARTYALYQVFQRRNKDYHLQADIRSQVYGGATSEASRSTAAVRETQGQILTYKGNIFPAYYSAACGGRRQDAQRVWGLGIRPLKSGPCGFCSSSPHQSWRTEMTAVEIREKISEKVQRVGQIYAVTAIGRDRSGRVIAVKIANSEGTISVPAHKFRMAIGPDKIKSTNFKVEQKNGHFIFTGHGWGHGVGLCQWGAAEMAEKGYDAEKILKHYYPASRIITINDYIEKKQ